MNTARLAVLLLLVISIGLQPGLASVSGMPATRPVSCPEGMTRVPDTDLCTHGDDPAPPGFDEDHPAPLLPQQRAARMATQLDCIGDGESGARVQVLYVSVSTGVSRYNEVLPSLRGWTAGIDTIVNTSAAETGGVRHVRFAHDASCAPTIPEVHVKSTSFSGMIGELRAQGFDRPDRQYVIWADATTYCGIGTITGSDAGAGYARIDRGCWGPATATHELFHTLGAVSQQAPNASGGWHCIDEYDVMCYSDDPRYPELRIDCPDRAYDQLLDCGNQDYFSTNPPAGSWLATHWNTADSRFLSSGGTPPPLSQPVPPANTSPPTTTPPPTTSPKPKHCRQNSKQKRQKCQRKANRAVAYAADPPTTAHSSQRFVAQV
jgi:hypothetical protein